MKLGLYLLYLSALALLRLNVIATSFGGTVDKTKLVEVADLGSTREYLAHKAEEQQVAFDPASVTEAIPLYQLVPEAVEIVD